MKKIAFQVSICIAILIVGIIIGSNITSRAEDNIIQSFGEITVGDSIRIDSNDLNVITVAYEAGKAESYNQAVEETITKVQASPKDYGISTSVSAIESVKGIAGSQNSGNQFYAQIPAGYDFALLTYTGYDDYGMQKYAGSLIQTVAAGRTGAGVYLIPLNGNAYNFYVYGKWGTGASVVAVKMK